MCAHSRGNLCYKKNDRLHEADGRREKKEMGMFNHSQKDLDSGEWSSSNQHLLKDSLQCVR